MNRSETSFSPFKSTLAVLIYIALIFITLPVVPKFVEFLKTFGPIGLIVNTSISAFLALVIIISMIRLRFVRWPFVLYFGPLGIITIWGLNHIALPIERVHIIEYGVLSVMLVRICRRYTNPFLAVVQSLFLASLAGAIDEGIQHFLPNRIFAMSDIYLNIAGAAAGIVYYGIYRWIRGPE